MKNLIHTLSHRRKAAAFIVKLHLLAIVAVCCFENELSAGIRSIYKEGQATGGNTIPVKKKKNPAANRGNLASDLTISYSSPQSYYVNTAITPLTPTATGVAAYGYSTSPVKVGSGYTSPVNVATDANGNVYIADRSAKTILKIPAAGGTPVALGAGFSQPSGVAIDAAGNVYVADYGNNAVKKIPVAGGKPVSIGTGFVSPYGIAVDVAGNVYVGDESYSTVLKITAGSNSVTAIGSGFSGPSGVAVDAAGNVYVADEGNSAVKEIPVAGGPPVALGSGFDQPYGVAVDAAGDIFVADYASNAIKEILSANRTTVVIDPTTACSGVAVDRTGNVFFADYGGDDLVKKISPVGGYFLNTALPAGLSFNSSSGAISGTPLETSKAINYTVTAYNSGGDAQAVVNIKVSENATLSNLVISSGTLTPAFISSTNNYTASVGNAVTSITETPTTAANTATVTVNGNTVTSGSPSAAIALGIGANTITTVVTAEDGVTTESYTVTVTRTASSNAKLSYLGLSQVTLSPAFSNATTSYTASVTNNLTSTNVEPIEVGPGATIEVNGVVVASGASTPVALSVGVNTINTVVTAQDGVTQVIYSVVVTRAPSAVATLSDLTFSSGTLSPAFGSAKTSYTAAVGNAVTSITETPVTTDPTATVTVNGITVTSGSSSGTIALGVGGNTITTVVTAQDGSTTDTYTVTVTRSPSSNAKLSYLGLSKVVLSPSFATANTTYTSSVTNAITSTNVEPIEVGPGAIIAVNGVTVASGSSTPVALGVGSNVINTVVTAQDGVTQLTYAVTVTRAAPTGAFVVYNPISVEKPTDSPQLADDGIVVHQGVSPNGDGIDDYLQIDGITNYPHNKLTIINRSGLLVYETKGYDNSSRLFDGHSNKNGQMQLPGTYFYSLDYMVGGIIKHRTGYIVLKY